MKDNRPEVRVDSTASQLEDFIKNSFIWKDMVRELEMWKEMNGREYRDVETLLHLGKIKGRIEALEYFLQLPRVLSEVAKENQEERLKEEEQANVGRNETE